MEKHDFYFRKAVSGGKSGVPLLRRPGALHPILTCKATANSSFLGGCALQIVAKYLTQTLRHIAQDHNSSAFLLPIALSMQVKY